MSKITKIYFREPIPDKTDKASARFQGRGFHTGDGWEIQVLDGRPTFSQLVHLKHAVHGTWVVRNLPYEVFTDDAVNMLGEREFTRMNLPEEYRAVVLEKVPESIRVPVENYCVNVTSMLAEGLGFIFGGPAGVGKTSAAAVIALAARAARKSVFFATVGDLRELIRNRIPFENEQSVLDRCREVDLLIIDSLRVEDGKAAAGSFEAKGLSLDMLEAMIESRVQWKRSTIMTTRLASTELAVPFAGILSIVQGTSIYAKVDGPNQRQEKLDLAKQKMLLPGPKKK